MRKHLTYYEILGVPTGAAVDHVKASYRLMTRRSAITDVAFQTLTNPKKRAQYDDWLFCRQQESQKKQSEQDCGSRGRERCSCGKTLEEDDDWYCKDCCGKIDYFVVFDISGGYVIHDSEMPIVTDSSDESYWHTSDGPVFGPFTREEAEKVLTEKNRMRDL